MARLVVVFAVVALITAQTSASAQSDQYLVGNGQFGLWKLGAPGQEAITRAVTQFGPSYQTGEQTNLKGSRFFWWESAGFKLTTFQDKVVAVTIWRRYGRHASRNAELIKYKTPEEIRIGDPLSKVIAAYGNPDFQWQIRWSSNFVNTGMQWGRIQLYIEIHEGTVDALGVFDPSVAWGQ